MSKCHFDKQGRMPSTGTMMLHISGISFSPDLSAYHIFDPRPQMGKSFEPSTKVVPRRALFGAPSTIWCAAATNRRPSKVSGWGYLDGLCMISQAGTHAISPTSIRGPPFLNWKGFIAFRRIPTAGVVSKSRCEIVWSVGCCLLLSNGLSLTDSLMKLSSICNLSIPSQSNFPACWISSYIISTYSGRAHSSRKTKWRF